MCWSCYFKFREANLPLPLRLADRKGDPIEAWVTILTLDVVERLQRALAAQHRFLSEACTPAQPKACLTIVSARGSTSVSVPVPSRCLSKPAKRSKKSAAA